MDITHKLSEIKKNGDLLFKHSEIERAVLQMSQKIDRSYSSPITILCVLTGGLYIACDVSRHLKIPHQILCIKATRYHQGTEGKNLIFDQVPSSLINQDVLIIDDCMDEGMTLMELQHACLKMGAKSVKSAVLLNKTGLRKHLINPDFFALESHTSDFVYGYGLDIQGYLRELKDLWTIPSSLFHKIMT